MKTIFTLVAFFFVFAQTSVAQEGQGNEKIEQLKIAFITKHLKLTTEEAQKFWPVYNQYEAEKKQVRQSTIGSIKELKKYISEFKKFLPSTKIAKLVTAEERFKKMLAKQAQQGGNGNGQKPWKNK